MFDPPVMRACLVATDMDGTLLNHHDYRFDAVMPCLALLQSRGVPVVLNTSKTFAELAQWRERLAIPHPFIVENGSAIFIPPDYFHESVYPADDGEMQLIDDYRVLVCGRPIDELRAYLAHHPVPAEDLSSCSLQQAMEMTGLDEADAALAQRRDFSIPLRFADDYAETEFAERAQADGFGILKGGRFLHLIGETDKGQSQLRLKQLYARSLGTEPLLVALGDSPNDIQMLKAADIAVLVNSPSSPQCKLDHGQLIRTRQSAPEGWVEGIERALAMVDDTD